ncbi:MAG: hypothetical protein Hals2KO_14990 [Halioglobus sp.]
MPKYDERSNKRRAELQTRQLEESMSLDRRIAIAQSRETDTISEFYGQQKVALQGEIDELNRKLTEKGVRAAIYRTIHGSRDRELLNRNRETMQSIDARIGERFDAFDSRAFVVKQNLSTRHDIQRENLEMDIENPSVRPRSRDTTTADMAVSGFREFPRQATKGRSR